jgi:hypothetical protein
MSIALKTSTALPACSACVSQDTPGLRSKTMSIALKTSTTRQLRCVRVSQDTPDL